MKKILAFVMSIMMLPTVQAFAKTNVAIMIDGEMLYQKGQKAIIEDGTTMIPFRTLLEGLGAYVEWIPSTRSIIAAKDEIVLKMQIDSNKVVINGAEMIIESAPVIMNDTTMIPLRAISNLLNAEVEWSDAEKTVYIKTYRPIRDHKSEEEYFIKEFKSDSGETLLKVVVEYPVFTGTSSGMAVLTRSFSMRAKAFADEAIGKFSEAALDKYDEAKLSGQVFEPMYILYQHDITYDEYGFISIIEQASTTDGEVVFFDSAIFDAKTGNFLPHSEYMHMEKEEAEILKAYSAYIYEGNLVLMLNSNNSYLSESMGYPPAVVVPTQYIKFNLMTGEVEGETTKDENGRIKEVRVLYENVAAVNSALGFKMPNLKDEIVNVPESYAIINDKIGEIVYNRDVGTMKITLRKTSGDVDISGIEDVEEYKSEVYKNSKIDIFQNDTQSYAFFTIEKENGIFSYTLAINNNDNKYLLTRFAKEIIDFEMSK